MKIDEWHEVLAKTLEDRRLSRGEKRALSGLVDDAQLDGRARALVRSRAFDLAREAMDEERQRAVVDWLEEVVKVLDQQAGETTLAEAHFSPGEDCRNRIASLIRSASRSMDICVFTLTDDLIAREVRQAHERGTRVRLIADQDKSLDLGSDIEELRRAGVPVRLDNSKAHMHHKFALFDGGQVLTGSYNWTRSAFRENEENVVVSDDVRFVKAFQAEFDALWAKFG